MEEKFLGFMQFKRICKKLLKTKFGKTVREILFVKCTNELATRYHLRYYECIFNKGNKWYKIIHKESGQWELCKYDYVDEDKHVAPFICQIENELEKIELEAL